MENIARFGEGSCGLILGYIAIPELLLDRLGFCS